MDEKLRALLSTLSCGYCREALDIQKMESIWDEREQHHYKSLSCTHCGKKTWMRTCVPGSGHEHYIKEDSIESIVKKVREG